jgi:hypothetical protein
MDQKQIVRQMLEFNKAAFDNNFKAMALLQDQTENFVSRFLEKAAWMPDDGKKAINKWLDVYKKGRTDFKVCADENYRKAVDFFAQSPTQKERNVEK